MARTAPQTATLPPSARVVIVGGGFAGAATAYWLVEAGVREVVIVEREATCGYHASGRNAAMGRQVTESDHFTGLTVAGAAFLRRPPSGFAEAPLLSGCGSLLLASDPVTLDRVAGAADRFDVPHRVVDPAGVVAGWPLLRGTPLAGAVSFPTDGVIDVHELLTGFLAGARRGGARVITRCEVIGFAEVANGQVEVATSAGVVRADCVVMAAGAWAGTLGERAGGSHGFDPVQRHLFITERTDQVPADAPFAWHLDDEFYVRPEVGGLLVSGCDQSVRPPADARPDADADQVLARKLARMAPALTDLGIARRWACMRTFTAEPERRPVIDWDPGTPWLYWVAGLGGHGATASAEIGRQAAAGIASRLGLSASVRRA